MSAISCMCTQRTYLKAEKENVVVGRDHRKTAGGRLAGQGNRKGDTSVKPLKLVQTNGASTGE